MGIAALLLMFVPRLALAQTGFPDVRTLCRPVSIQGDKPEERPCLQQLRDVVERDDNVLTLKLDNGKAKVFKSNMEACERGPDGCVEYRLAGYIESDRQFVVQVLQYEYSFVSLVSRRNGNVTKLEDWPHLSRTISGSWSSPPTMRGTSTIPLRFSQRAPTHRSSCGNSPGPTSMSSIHSTDGTAMGGCCCLSPATGTQRRLISGPI
jgi:hypothetical protein